MEFVQAAGGVVWRRSADGRVEVLLVHRPLAEEWTLPRRRLREGELGAEAALRAAEEDAGLRCRLGPPLGALAYTGLSGLPKLVRYFALEAQEGVAFVTPGEQVDDAVWVDAAAAARVLSHPREVGVVQALRELPAPDLAPAA